MRKEARIRLLLIVTLALVSAFVWIVPLSLEDAPERLRVVFFDVGQGDAIYIESPTGVQVLIDGGAGPAVLRALSREMGFFDRTIDVVVATHPDTDHIGGLVDVLKRYDVGVILKTENTGESMTASAFFAAVRQEGAQVIDVRRGMEVELGGGAILTILFPDRDPSFLESNTSSIIARLVFGESEFLFTGDAPKSIEEYLVLIDGEELRSDVLKVGHHGSRTSTSEPFLSAVEPEYAVISAGRDNRYGHPHADVVEALQKEGADILSTMDGDVAFESDGVTLWRK